MRRFLRIKALALFALIVTAVMAVLPSFLPPERLPAFISETFTRKFQLGLDLQGGLHLEYSVAVDLYEDAAHIQEYECPPTVDPTLMVFDSTVPASSHGPGSLP